MTEAWRYFLTQVWNRTGGNSTTTIINTASAAYEGTDDETIEGQNVVDVQSQAQGNIDPAFALALEALSRLDAITNENEMDPKILLAYSGMGI